MDKNTITGFILIVLIMIGSYFLLKPSDAEIKKEKHLQDSIALAKAGAKDRAAIKSDTSKKIAAVDTAALKGIPFGLASSGTEKFITLENQELLVKLSNKGGRVYSVELKNFKTYDKKPLILFDGDENNSFGLNLRVQDKPFNTNDYFFSTSAQNLSVAAKDSASVTLRLNYSATQFIDYIYTLKGTGFKLGLTIKTTGLDNVIANSNTLNLNWAASMRKQEKDIKLDRTYSTLFYLNTDNDVDYLSEGKDDQKNIIDKKMQWVAFKEHFFSGVLISKTGAEKSDLSVSTDATESNHVKQMKANLAFARGTDGSLPLEFYFGPNQFSLLQEQGHNLDKIVNLGWGPLKYINRYATIPIFNQLKKFNWNYGFVILALTVILKLVLSPLTYKSYLSMAKMRILKPEMDEIKAKVGEDNPTLLQQEYMKLYKKAGVNPLGGCLPLLLQMPIVIAFFRFFPSLFELRGQSFLWMHDLSTYDSVITFAPIFGTDHISLMCLLMTISTLVYTYFNNQISGATGQMKYIGYITPIIFLITLNSYPSGLNYYYFLANMFTFLQQYLIRLMVDDKKIHAQIQENKKKPEDKKKKSGFQARMEEMMRQQQQVKKK